MPKHPKTSKPVDPASWRKGSEGFFRFLADVQPRVRDSRGGFTPYNPTGEMRDAIAQAIDSGCSTAVFCWPRRHGKTVAAIMLALWKFLTASGESIAIVANSEKQAVDTAFKALLDAFRQTPFLKSLTARVEVKLGADRIEAPELSNTIQAYTANPAALWGKKLTLAQISELHAATSDGVLDALQGSLLDSAGSLLLIDSTVGPKSSPLFGLFNASKTPDSGVYFSHIEYRDLEHAVAASPAWIDTKKLRALSRTMLPAMFGLMHLNRWQDASGSLFPPDVIARCVDAYQIDPRTITAGAAFVVGGGLDRAFGMSQHGDATVTTAVLKTVVDEDEHFYVLASDSVMFSRLGGIRANFTDYARKFGMCRVGIESFNAGDVRDWALQQPYADGVELIHPNRNLKASAFTTLYQAAAEGRLHIHPDFKKLLGEMATFEVSFDGKRANDGAIHTETTTPRFQHARGAHDDYLHSLCWAVHSLRESVLNAYELDGVHCYGSGPSVSLCVLNGGQMIPFGCADQCRSMHEARRLHDGYLERKPISPLPADEFIATRVKNVGPHSLPR
jgi:hypothetical protein